MARDESSCVPSASVEKRSQQLNAKLALLNRDFVRFLCDEVGKDAEVDLTPTVNSYVENVKDLRRMYNLGGGGSTKEAEKRDGAEGGRKKATARRRLKEGAESKGAAGTSAAADVTLPAAPKMPQMSSTPAGTSAPKFDLSADISAISAASPFGFGSSSTKKIDTDDTLKVLPPTLGAPSAGAGGRKRAIRGGGPLGDGESVVFRGAEGAAASSTPTITVKPPPIDFQLPKGTSSFWNKSSEGNKAEEKKEESKKDEEKEKQPFIFGGAAAAPKFTGFNFGGVPSSSSASSSAAPSPLKPLGGGGLNLFGSPLASLPAASSSSAAAPLLTFGAKPTGGMPLAFPSLAPKPATEGGADAAAGGDGEEKGEYVPPKAEVVENKEEDAKISLKCAVFKLEGGEYAKMGVGQLHLKEKDGKSTLLVRAATATGAIWVNGRVDASMKAEKAAEDKIRVSVPVSASEIKTFLIRIGAKEDAAKVLAMLKEGGAK